MVLRKINAILGLLTTLFLLTHAISTSVWMLSRGSVAQWAPIAPWILAGLMAAHAFVSIDLVISPYMEGENRRVKSYLKMNRSTVFQRISGILLIVFTALHVAGASGAMQAPHIVHAIVHPLLFAIALAHAAVSTDKALITLGIGNARFVKAVGVIMRVICAATLIAAVIGVYLYIW
ncbi:MAG: hypothetical protein IIX80_01370 [Clostridia bacterium]|nr:hypothetical protein [Clostridia bacterium]